MLHAHSTSEIDAAAVLCALAPTRFAGSVQHFTEVGSTQTLALEAARSGTKAGVWVADAQTAGRGRGGHTWHSAPGEGLYVTALLTPRLPANLGTLSLVAGLAAWEAIREVSGLLADIRWPNDLVTRPGVHPRARKLGGVLVESAIATASTAAAAVPRYVVVGLGLNVGHAAFPPELRELATSLRLEGWPHPERQPLLIGFLHRLDRAIHELEAGFAGQLPVPDIRPRLLEASTWIAGKSVQVPEEGGYTGVTDGLDPDGFLRVRDSGGALRTVRSGGVREI